jgi:hypothetical protein
MVAWILPPNGLIEPVPAPEIYVDGIGAIELLTPGTVRVHLIAEQLPIESPVGIPQKVVVVKVVGPMLNLPMTIGQLAMALIREPVRMPERGPHLVK